MLTEQYANTCIQLGSQYARVIGQMIEHAEHLNTDAHLIATVEKMNVKCQKT